MYCKSRLNWDEHLAQGKIEVSCINSLALSSLNVSQWTGFASLSRIWAPLSEQQLEISEDVSSQEAIFARGLLALLSLRLGVISD